MVVVVEPGLRAGQLGVLDLTEVAGGGGGVVAGWGYCCS